MEVNKPAGGLEGLLLKGQKSYGMIFQRSGQNIFPQDSDNCSSSHTLLPLMTSK